MEESVKCVVLQIGNMHMSANQTQDMGLGTSCTTHNSLIGGEKGIHKFLEPNWIDVKYSGSLGCKGATSMQMQKDL
eukprot:1585241-Ditylum_brightwellii.AAC.1